MATEADDQIEDAAATSFVERGADLAGALAGGALSLVGGPLGALGGAAVGVAVKHVVAGLSSRLAARQSIRAGAAVLFIADDAQARAVKREEPRQDGFFDGRGALRSDAEEVLEAILLQAANSYQEQKVPYIAHLYDGVAHDVNVQSADAHVLISLADRLSYRQLVTMAVLADNDRYFRALARAASLRDEGRSAPPETLLIELDQLGEFGLVGARVEGKGPFRQGAVYGTQKRMSDQPFGALRLMPLGELLHRLMRLAEVPGQECDAWVAQLMTP